MAKLIPQIVDEAADRTPAKEAFRHDGAAVGYAELAARANRLAHTLAATGLRPGDLAGIYMGKSLHTATAVFGIQKAGAAYVPLDPAAPPERTNRILRECRIRHVVSDDRHAARLGELAAAGNELSHVFGPATGAGHANVVGWDEVTTAPATTPPVQARPGDPAYVIFTSGSTGAPKGIVHTHASGLAYARMAARLYGLRSDDRLSNFPPLHFDQSTFDFFAGPLAGATTVIIGAEHQLVPASLSQLVEDERLTVWYSVPFALIRLLLYGELHARDHSSLRWVIYGGEPFPPKHLRALMARWPHARFSNNYGPAETNQVTYHHFGPGDDDDVGAERPVPIGRPCDGVAALVVGEDGAEVTPGVAGELLVDAPTAMQGYWAAPELTAAAFRREGRRRYYRTGDLVRRRPDGLLEFAGRVDRQVKTRGFRVELDEVEAVLSSHPAVREAAVYPVAGGDTTLIRAGVILEPGADPATVRSHAARRLPGYAVPDGIDAVDDLPRTATGKVDYLALTGEGALR